MDSIKVYVKSKDVFGWPEDTEDFPESTSAPAKSSTPSTSLPGLAASECAGTSLVSLPLTSIDRYGLENPHTVDRL